MGLAAIIFSAPAQNEIQNRDQVRLGEHLMLQNGEMYRVQDQQRTRLQETLTLQNGTKVSPDGTCRLGTGKSFKLRDGQCLDMQGTRYKSQEALQQRTQMRSQAMAQEHVLFQNGKLYRVKDRSRVEQQEALSLNNGATIKPDGSVQLQNGRSFQLQNGECLDMAGNRYRDQDRFAQRQESRMNRGMGGGNAEGANMNRANRSRGRR